MLVKRTMSKNVVCVSVPGNRDKVLDLMRKEKKAVLPVVKEDTDILVGLVTRSDLINNPDEEHIAMLMTRELITVKPGDDVVDAARVMMENNVRRVPVVNDDGELVGIITSFDLVSKALTKIEVNDAVENYMITTVPTTWEKAPLNVAFESMNQFGLKSILALDDEAKLSGILTETDFISEIEIAVTQRSDIRIDSCPIMVNSVCGHENLAVVAAQVSVNGQNTFCFKFNEHGVNKLYYIIAPHLRKSLEQSPQE